MMFAAGMLLVITRLIGSTLSTAGAAPKLHCKVAPAHTWGHDICYLLSNSL